MRYIIILFALAGCTTTQTITACEKAEQHIAAAEQAIAQIRAACKVAVPE